MAADSAPANPSHLTYQSLLGGISGPKLLLIQLTRTMFNDPDLLQIGRGRWIVGATPCALRRKPPLGEKVLILGAAGSFGSAAVQIVDDGGLTRV